MVNPIYSGVSFAGEISLTKCNLIQAVDERLIDIRGMVGEIDLHEDLFSNTMSGSITMVEDFNLISDLPILGEELVEIEVKSKAFDDKLSTIYKKMWIYKIGKREVPNTKKNVYVLFITSQESLLDLNIKISRAFEGSPGDIALSIYKENYQENNSNFKFEKSGNLIKFVSNYWSPFKCINFLASKATSNDSFGSPGYLFFENNRCYNFRSLQSLYTANSVAEYWYDDNQKRIRNADGESSRDVAREYQTATDIYIDSTVDYVARFMSGALGHRMYSYDVLNKKYDFNDYDYFFDFDKTSHLEKHPMVSKYAPFETNARLDVTYTMPFIHNNIKYDKNADISLKRRSLLAQTEMYKIDLEVPGRTDIAVGDVVNFNMLNYSTVEKADMNRDMKDRYYSGRYLVGAIIHRITQSKHISTVQLYRESFLNEITFGNEI